MTRILLLDDDESIRMLYAEELREEGYEIYTSGDDKTFWALYKKHSPDLIVMDIRLGNNNGLDLLKKIRQATYTLPVILCSAYSAYRNNPISIAADYYVVKEGNLNELKQKIRLALQGYKKSYKDRKTDKIRYVPILANG